MPQTPSTDQTVFDETYELELPNLLSVGLSPKNAIASALALAQAAVNEMSSQNFLKSRRDVYIITFIGTIFYILHCCLRHAFQTLLHRFFLSMGSAILHYLPLT